MFSVVKAFNKIKVFIQKSEQKEKGEQELEEYSPTLVNFPAEVLVSIFRQCVKDEQNIQKVFQAISRISQVCKRFKQICEERYTWQEVLRGFFKDETITVVPPSEFIPVFKLFLRRYRTGQKYKKNFEEIEAQRCSYYYVKDDFFQCLRGLQKIDPKIQKKISNKAERPWADYSSLALWWDCPQEIDEFLNPGLAYAEGSQTQRKRAYNKIDAFWKGYIEEQEKALISICTFSKKD